jgi:desulfoferrodoxin (superoxide reductase-like protein)
MRIGHQIYNYLCDYTDDGKVTIAQPIECIPNWPTNKEVSFIHEASIKWDEDQVYLLVVTGEIPTYMTINGFLKWMGGSTRPQNYKPLYELRNRLKVFAIKVRKTWKHNHTSNIH